MSKQMRLFADDPVEHIERKYTTKVDVPIYEPRHSKPHILSIYDTTKAKSLIREVDESGISSDEKEFLRAAAWRHAVFNYEVAADYYAHASPEMQRLMERSALVIVDFDEAIERGFVRLCSDIRSQYLEHNGDADA